MPQGREAELLPVGKQHEDIGQAGFPLMKPPWPFWSESIRVVMCFALRGGSFFSSYSSTSTVSSVQIFSQSDDFLPSPSKGFPLQLESNAQGHTGFFSVSSLYLLCSWIRIFVLAGSSQNSLPKITVSSSFKCQPKPQPLREAFHNYPFMNSQATAFPVLQSYPHTFTLSCFLHGVYLIYLLNCLLSSTPPPPPILTWIISSVQADICLFPLYL